LEISLEHIFPFKKQQLQTSLKNKTKQKQQTNKQKKTPKHLELHCLLQLVE